MQIIRGVTLSLHARHSLKWTPIVVPRGHQLNLLRLTFRVLTLVPEENLLVWTCVDTNQRSSRPSLFPKIQSLAIGKSLMKGRKPLTSLVWQQRRGKPRKRMVVAMQKSGIIFQQNHPHQPRLGDPADLTI